MTVIIINQPTEPCYIADIYMLISKWGKTKGLRNEYKHYLEEHQKECKKCKRIAFEEELKDKEENGL